MKHLTITLLTLLVLGGCSQESTELERCIEANTKSISVHSMMNDYQLIWAIDDKFGQCLGEKLGEEVRLKLFWEGYSFNESYDKEILYCFSKHKNEHIDRIFKRKKDEALMFCHTQGIY